MRSLESLRKLMVESKPRKKINVVTTIYPGMTEFFLVVQNVIFNFQFFCLEQTYHK